MIPYLGCEVAREMLPAFVDRELPVDAQVAVENHLRWCGTCAAHVEDLELIGNSLRAGAPSAAVGREDRSLAGLQAGILSRIRAERDQSVSAHLRRVFEDLHLFWAGVGATTAVTFCLFATMGVMYAASDERPDSLAGIIQTLANPGSDSNPVRLDAGILAPRALDSTPALEYLPEEEAVFALATVVTREGRIANYELLLTQRNGARRGAVRHGPDVTALLNAVSRSRFEPAQAGGAPVAVNMVWLLARTTVKGTARGLDFGSPQLWRPEVMPVTPVDSKPLEGSPAPRPAARRSTTA
jgi:hypothetical protein